MKKNWISVALFVGIGTCLAFGASIISVANSVNYEVLSYQIQYLDAQGVTFRVMFGLTNPSGYNLEVWQQRYDVYIAGYKVSEITSKNRYKLIPDNMSIIPLDIRLSWQDIQDKVAPLASSSSVVDIGTLPVLIKGKLSAKMGILKLAYVPFRMTLPLSNFLP